MKIPVVVTNLFPKSIIRIGSNIISLGGAGIISRLLSLVLFAFLARKTGVEGVGTYSFAVAIGGYFQLLADTGLANYLVQSVSADPVLAVSFFNQAAKVKTRLYLIIVPVSLIVAVLTAETSSQIILTLLVAIAMSLMTFSELNYALFRTREFMLPESVLIIIRTSVFVLLSLYLLNAFSNIAWVGVTLFFAVFVEWLISSFLRVKYFFPMTPAPTTSWNILRKSLPFATTSLVATAFSRIDVIVIGLIATVAMVGEYTAVSRVLLTFSILPLTISRAIWPVLARLYNKDRQRFIQTATFSVSVNLILGTAIFIFVHNFSKIIIFHLYGEDLVYLAPLLQLGGVFVVFKFVTLALGFTLTGSGYQVNRTKAIFLGLGVTIITIVVFVPFWGVRGAVWALIISEISLASISFYYCKDMIVWSTLARTMIVVAMIYLFNFLIYWLKENLNLNHPAIDIAPVLLSLLVGGYVILKSAVKNSFLNRRIISVKNS